MWLERDDTGRPRCEHGWAHKGGRRWRCPAKKYVSDRRYDSTPQGREVIRRRNADGRTQSRKALYELTRVRVS